MSLQESSYMYLHIIHTDTIKEKLRDFSLLYEIKKHSITQNSSTDSLVRANIIIQKNILKLKITSQGQKRLKTAIWTQ